MNPAKIFLADSGNGKVFITCSGGLFGNSRQRQPENPALLKLSSKNLARRQRGMAQLRYINTKYQN
jgi:hypothetical protein